MSIAENTNFVNSGDVVKSDLILELLTDIIKARRDRGWDISLDALNLISGSLITDSDMTTVINELTYHEQGINYANKTFISIPKKGSFIYKDYINKLQIARTDIVNLVRCSSGCTSACIDTCIKDCSQDCSQNCGQSCTSDCGEECRTDCGVSCTSICNDECMGCVNICSDACTAMCNNTCTGDCDNTCRENCTAYCSDTCTAYCSSNCVRTSHD